MLAATNYEITEAENGEQALAAIAKERPDLILMDIQLPIMDGYTATRRIKDNPALRSIPIIAVTSYVEEQKAQAAGCDELAEGEPVQFPEGTKAHRVLELGYLGNVKLSRQQIECAKHALPHENPRLGVIATTAMNADDFAATLDRAIARSGLLIEHRPDEGAKSPDPIPPRGSPRQGLFGSPDKRFRR